MNPDRTTVKMQEALAGGQSVAGRYGHAEIKPSHVFLALLDQSDGIARPLLEKVGANVSSLKSSVEAHLARQQPARANSRVGAVL